jgi:ribosomal-protein-alanine N-acetyltransferase
MEEMGISTTDQLKLEISRIKRLLKTDLDNWRIWDILEKKSEQLMGNCGFHNYVADHKRAEIGYWLNENYRKNGYMREAVKSMVDFGFSQMKLNRIEAILDPNNTPSKNLLEFLDFTYEGRLRDHYIYKGKIIDSLIYSITISDMDEKPNK